MWIIGIAIGLLFSSVVQAQGPSQCVQKFDRNFRQCFRDFGGMELEVVFSLVTNGTSGQLPQQLTGQRQNLVNTQCGNIQSIKNCIGPLPNTPDQTCQQSDVGMMAGTVNSMISGLGNLCGQPTAPPACLQNFDKGFRACLQSAQIVPDQFFMLLANQSMPPNVNKDQLKQLACREATRQGLLGCSTSLVTKLQKECKTQQTIMVGTTLQNMLGAYEGVCTGKTVNPNQCMAKFETGMNTCAQKTLNMDMKMILMVLNNQTLPTGANRAQLKKTICGLFIHCMATCEDPDQTTRKRRLVWVNTGRKDQIYFDPPFVEAGYAHVWQLKPLEMCGKDVLTTAGCSGGQMLSIEATFANMMITTATFCGDTTSRWSSIIRS